MTGQIDVFISYKREERARSERVKRALIAAGYTVVTDLNIGKNEEFGDAIDIMIRTATLTLVLWTKASAVSDWVRQEARLARDLEKAGKRNRYLGVMVEDVELELPPDLRGLQMVNIRDCGLDEPGLAKVLDAARDILGAEVLQDAQTAAAHSEAMAEEWQFYDLACSINVAATYERYLALYPNGEFAHDARRHLGMFTWYLHPFRRGNLSNTLAALGIVGTVAATIWGASRDSVVIGVEPHDHTSIMAERDIAIERAETLAGEKAEAEAQAHSVAETLAKKETALGEAEVRTDVLAEELAEANLQARRAAEAQQVAETALSQTQDRANALQSERDNAQARLFELPSLSQPDPDCKADGKPGIRIPELARCVALDATILNLSETGLTDLTPLSGLTSLQELYVSFTEVSDLAPLSGLTALQILRVDYTGVSDLSPLSNLIALQTLNVRSTGVSDLSPLSNLIALQTLNVGSTGVSDLSPLSGLTELTLLFTPDGGKHEGQDAVQASIATWSP